MKSNATLVERSYSLKVDGEELLFDFRRAIYWENRKSLIIADFHIGKAGHFRKNGIAISNSVSKDDFVRLNALIDSYSPERLMILGDLSHSRINKEWYLWLEYREKHSNIEVVLVPGNHDILPKSEYERAKIIQTKPIHILEPFIFIHESIPTKGPELRQISGHIHPGVRLNGAARQGITLPCFYISEAKIILPAFSGFTGKFKVKPKKKDKVLAIMHRGMVLIE